jgi:putative peptidoglycan lipid II flippase
MRLLAVGVVLGAAFYAGRRFSAPLFSGFPHFSEEILLLALLLLGLILYGGLVVTFVGRAWLRGLLRDAATASGEQSVTPDRRS